MRSSLALALAGAVAGCAGRSTLRLPRRCAVGSPPKSPPSRARVTHQVAIDGDSTAALGTFDPSLVYRSGAASGDMAYSAL